MFRGRVTGVDDDLVHLELQAERTEDGRVLMPATASVRLPRRS